MVVALIAVIIIVGGTILLDHLGTPTSGPREKVSQTVRSSPANNETVDVAPAGSRRYEDYEDATLLFTLDYPEHWTHRKEANSISFMPPSPAPQDAEPNPRIILTLEPLVNVLGAHAQAAAWFDTEVLQNAERWGERADTQDGNPRYSFTEGMGEYPHENIIILHGATAYRFTIAASDPAIHAVLPQIAASLEFKQ